MSALWPMAGCGSDDASSASNDQETIVKADFIQAANEICKHRNEEMLAKLRPAYKQAEKLSNEAAAKKLLVRAIVPGFAREVRDLRALQPPPGEEDEVEAVINTIQEMLDRTRKDFAIGRDYPYRKTENVAAAYGLPACGHP